MKRVAALMLLTFALAGSSAAEQVGVRLTGRREVIVPVRVNGRGPYDFLLDTGSTTSVVAETLAEELGLASLGNTVVRTASGSARTTIARVDRIEIGTRSARTVLVLRTQLDGVRAIDGAIRGVLGFNFLSRFQYLLDYRRKRLVFGHHAPVGGSRLPFDAGHRSIVLVAHNLRLLLDTGATGVVLFERDGSAVEATARRPSTVSTTLGRRIVRSGWIRRLTIGDETFLDLPVALVPQTGLEPIADGLLPGRLFDAIYFDHIGHQVVLNPTNPRDDGPVPSASAESESK